MDQTEKDPKMTAYELFLRGYARLLGKISDDMNSAGQMSLDVYDVLVTLEFEEGQSMRLSDLADKVLMSRSGLTRRLDRLEKLGYVERKVCPSDKRGAFAVLTEKGQIAREEAWPTYRDLIKSHFGDRMTEGESKQLAALMTRIVDPLE